MKKWYIRSTREGGRRGEKIIGVSCMQYALNLVKQETHGPLLYLDHFWMFSHYYIDSTWFVGLKVLRGVVAGLMSSFLA